jgi:hypothetical protein
MGFDRPTDSARFLNHTNSAGGQTQPSLILYWCPVVAIWARFSRARGGGPIASAQGPRGEVAVRWSCGAEPEAPRQADLRGGGHPSTMDQTHEEAQEHWVLCGTSPRSRFAGVRHTLGHVCIGLLPPMLPLFHSLGGLIHNRLSPSKERVPAILAELTPADSVSVCRQGTYKKRLPLQAIRNFLERNPPL